MQKEGLNQRRQKVEIGISEGLRRQEREKNISGTTTNRSLLTPIAIQTQTHTSVTQGTRGTGCTIVIHAPLVCQQTMPFAPLSCRALLHLGCDVQFNAD